MPMIPRETTQTVFADARAIPYEDVQASAADFGGLQAQAEQRGGAQITQGSNDLQQTAMLAQQFANESSATSALNSAQQNADDLMNGNPARGITGFTTLSGINAVSQQQQYQAQVQQVYQQARDSLNPAAQRMFDMTAHWALRSTMSRLGAHAAEQQSAYEKSEAAAAVTANINTTVSNADDPGGAWARGLAAIRDASQRQAQLWGLNGDAANQLLQQNLGRAYVQRAQALAQRDPIAAETFFQQNVAAFPPDQRYTLERSLHSMATVQYSASDASRAVHNALGLPDPGAPGGGSASAPLPQNFNAPIVKAYDAAHIQQIALQTKQASPYDAIINKVAAQYHLNPVDLKMRLAVESGLNPKAVSPQGAVGIAQITPDTAKALGIDPSDPQQAIDGAARLIVKAQAASGGDDPSAVDRAYYGGNVDAQGPNTDQYVANLSAVRAVLHGGQVAQAPMTSAELEGMEGDVLRQADALAEQRRPGDAAYRLQVEAQAQSQLARRVQVVRGQEYSDATNVLDAVVKGQIQTPSELPAPLLQVYSRLTPQNQEAVQAEFHRNVLAASGGAAPSDAGVFNSLQSRLYLPAGDPQRINDPSQVIPYVGKGLSYADSQRLVTELKDLNNPSTNPFLHQVNQVKLTAMRMLEASPTLASAPLEQEAAYRFNFALDQQIAAMRKAGKDPSVLFDPTNPDYVLRPARVASFLPKESGAVGAAASATPGASAAAPPTRYPGESAAAYLTRVGFQGNS